MYYVLVISSANNNNIRSLRRTTRGNNKSQIGGWRGAQNKHACQRVVFAANEKSI
jgi:hypothetical protein